MYEAYNFDDFFIDFPLTCYKHLMQQIKGATVQKLTSEVVVYGLKDAIVSTIVDCCYGLNSEEPSTGSCTLKPELKVILSI